jgi:hypothetical protein
MGEGPGGVDAERRAAAIVADHWRTGAHVRVQKIASIAITKVPVVISTIPAPH